MVLSEKWAQILLRWPSSVGPGRCHEALNICRCEESDDALLQTMTAPLLPE